MKCAHARPVDSSVHWPRLILLAVLAMATCAAGAQAEALPADGAAPAAPDTLAVHGVVVDSATGEPLPATSVRLLELNRQDVTHDDGGFHLEDVPAGSYTLVVERLGYGTETLPLEVPVQGPRVEVRMTSSAIDLPGLMVTATLGARSREDAHRLSQVLGGRDLQRQLDVTLAETLEGEAGLASASMGPAPARPVIRGLSGDRILVLEDGERVGDVSSGSADHAVAVESSSAERIEVVRGPAALFYGSNALGGVVNVVREEIPSALADHPTGSALLQGQSVNTGGAVSATYRQAVGSLGLRAEGSGRWTDDVRTPAQVLENSGIRTYSGGVGGAWIAGFGHAGVSARAYRSRYGIPPDPVAGHPDGVDVEVERDAYRGEAVVANFNGLGELTGTASYTRYDHREIEDGGQLGTAYGQNTGTAELVLQHDALGPFTSGGYGVRGQVQDYISDTGRDEVASRELSGAIYGLEELDLGAWSLQAGARFDIHSVSPDGAADVRGIPVRERTFQNVSGSVAALWEFARGWQFGTAVSRAFRAPSSDELFSQGPHLAAYTFQVGNPDLEAETGLGVDAFVRVERPGISAEGGVFWNDISDYSFPVNTGERRGELFVYRYVNTDARFWGAEASLRWVVSGNLVADGDLSYVRATNRALDQPLPMIPPLNGRLTLAYDLERWFIEAGIRGAAEQDRVPERPVLPPDVPGYCDRSADLDCQPVPGEFLPTDGYMIVNAGGGYRWFPGHQVHSVTLRVENLTDSLYRNHLSQIKELTPEPGFGATVTYRVSF